MVRLKKEKSKGPKYNMGQNVWFMIKLAWTSGEKKVLVLGLFSALLAVVLNLINLYITPTILSAVERHVSVAELVWTILRFVLAVMSVSAALAYVNVNSFCRVSVRMVIVNWINKKAATTSYVNVEDDEFKKMLSKAGESVGSPGQATQAIWDTIVKLLSDSMGFMIYCGLLTIVQPVLIVVVLGTTLVSYFIGKQLNEYVYARREEESEYIKQMNYFLWYLWHGEGSGAAKDIRIFGLRDWLDGLYNKAMDAYIAFHRKAQGIYIWARIIDLIMIFLRNGIAYAYLIGLVIRQDLDVSVFLLYFTAIGGFSEWVTGILGGLHTLHKQSMDISTVRECLEYKEPFRFEDGEPLQAQSNGKYEIRLERVSFRYPGADGKTLKNINLTLQPGEKLAVVGLNGAGKTTLIKLICGFLDPTEGCVLLNGKDIRAFNRRDYYTLFSAVFQSFSLLPGTIAVNVAQSGTDIDMERVKECVEKAGLCQKVEALLDGYETYLNREVYENAIQLSGGETQRLMLARALYKNAPIIVLDEPTAALDPIAEADMYQKYHEMTAGRSSIYISHRLASTRFCDRIIMIDGGEIIEEGTHEELLKLGGKYTELYEVQSRYYKEGEENRKYGTQ